MQEKEEEPSSDQLRHASIQDYLKAHAKPDAEGLRGFVKSNLFTALVMFLLTQAVFFGGSFVSFNNKINSVTEWKGQIDGILKRMDDTGTIHSHYIEDEQGKDLGNIDTRLKRVEDETRHLEVIESEHRRLTNDVEELKRSKK